MYARCLLAFLSFTLVLAWEPCHANENRDWLRGQGNDLELRLSGKLARQSDAPVDDVSVKVSLYNHLEEVEFPAKVVGDRYEVWLPVNRHDWYRVRIEAIDSGNDDANKSTIRRQDLRAAIIDGYDLVLRPPSRTVAIHVNHAGVPVADAKVRVQIGVHTLESISNADGIATFSVYSEDGLSSVVAYTDTLVGGFQPWRKPKRDPKAKSYDCAMHPIRRQMFRIVDEDGQPVPGISLNVKVATASPNFNYLGQTPYNWLTTNVEGEAFHERFPDWDAHHCYVDILNPEWINVDDLTWEDGIATQVVRRSPARSRVRGKLVGEPIAGLSVSVESFQHPRESRIDVRQVHTNADGSFDVDVFPGATYVAFVDDPVWVTPIKDWIPLPADGGHQAIELSVRKGVRVKAIVTAGDYFEPIENARVRFANDYRFSWSEEGTERYGTMARSTVSATGPDGMAEAWVLPGTVEVRGEYDGRSDQKEVTVVDGESMLVEFHRDFAEPQTVSGQLVSAHDAQIDFSGARIYTGAIDGATNESMETTADATGKFEFQTIATRFGVYAETTDGKFAGVAKSRDVSSTLEVKLFPMMAYRGRLLNKNSEPIRDHKVSTRLRVKGETDYDAPHSTLFTIREIDTKTDAHGYYVFPRLPAHLPMRIATYAPHNPDDYHMLNQVYLEPGEDRPLPVAQIDDGSPAEATADPQPALEERFAKVLRDCRLNGYRMMVIRHSGQDDVTEFTGKYLTSSRHQQDIARYMPLTVDGGKTFDEDDAALAESHGWPMVTDSTIFVSVHDSDGAELNRLTLGVDSSAAIETARAFIAKHAPLPVDAAREWEKAFALAKETGRRVWAINGGRYCGPCIRLTRWIDDRRDLLEQDYVFVKVDAFFDENGRDVADRITRGGQHGVPFHAIFSDDGDFLIDSDGPTGNIGMPGSFEGLRHLGQMLHETRQQLKSSDVDALVETLR